jgi:ribosome-binding factor A
MAAGEVKRSVRVGERMLEELAIALLSLRDPRLSGASITRVEVTDDLRFARVFVRCAVTAESADPAGQAARRTLLKGFDAASPRLRRIVTQAVGLRFAPELRFLYDEGLEATGRVEELLREIDTERRDRGD